MDIEDRSDLQTRFNEVSKSVGICWIAIAVMCRFSSGKSNQQSTWFALIAFHLMNTVAILAESRTVDFDGIVSVFMFALCVYGYRNSNVVETNEKKD